MEVRALFYSTFAPAMTKPVFVAPIPTGDAVLDNAIYIKHHRQYMKELAAYEQYAASPIGMMEKELSEAISKEIDRSILRKIMGIK